MTKEDKVIWFLTTLANDDLGERNKRDYEGRLEHLKYTLDLVAPGRYLHVDSRLSGRGLFIERILRIKDMLEKFPDAHVVYIDADAWLFHTIDEVFEHCFDVGVCYRGVWETEGIVNDINTGVIFFPSNTPGTQYPRRPRQLAFLDAWYETCKDNDIGWFTDQHWMNIMVGRPPKPRTLLEYVKGKRMSPVLVKYRKDRELNVMFFDALKYDCPLTMLETWRASIVHYNNLMSAQQQMIGIAAENGRVVQWG